MYRNVKLYELVEQLRPKFEDVPFWEEQEARNAINESLRMWNLLTGLWKRRIVQPLTANVPWVTIPSSITYGTRVQFNEDKVPLAQDSVSSLDFGRVGWETETTASGGDVPIVPTVWAPAGLRLICIWPSVATAGNQLVLDGVSDTPYMSKMSDWVDINEAEHKAILDYALHALAFKEGGERFAATMPFFQSFLRAALDQNARLKAVTIYRKAAGLDYDRAKDRWRPKEDRVKAG